MKLQLNTVKNDYISSRYIPFNINRKLILLSLILTPEPDFKVHLWKTAAHTGPGISCLPIQAGGIQPQTWVQPRYLLKWKHSALSQSSLVLLCPNWQEHTCSNTVLTGLPCFPRVDGMSDSPGVNWAELCVWQKWYKIQPHTFCYYLHTNIYVSQQNSNLLRQLEQTELSTQEGNCTNTPLSSKEMLHR